MSKLSLRWKVPGDGGAILIFNKAAWSVFQSTAEERCIATDEMLSAAIVKLVKGSRYHLAN